MHADRNGLQYRNEASGVRLGWDGPPGKISWDEANIGKKLQDLDCACHVVENDGRIGLTEVGNVIPGDKHADGQPAYLMSIPRIRPEQLGDPDFLTFHGVQYPLYIGSMAKGITSQEMVIALGRERILSSFGSAGLSPAQLEASIRNIQQALPEGPYAFCLIHSPSEPALEENAVNLYLKYGVRTLEASAFLDLTPNIVAYRVAGLSSDDGNRIKIHNRVIAKISRREVAAKFLQPAPRRILDELTAQGRITGEQARMAEQVPMADDITVEADSGGHTDNRPLVCLLPSLQELRDEMHDKYGYRVRMGAAGGIGTPVSALAAFMMGADYLVTGSINQACLEAGVSDHTRKLLAQVEMADVMMAPAADMFELGVKLQVLKRGTLFPMRAQKLYDLYMKYDAIEDIPPAERTKLEQQVFKHGLDEVWRKTISYFNEIDPQKIKKAQANPKRKMALIFRWYLGLSSQWANSGEPGRQMDYQIWCGPAMGAFNDWTRGTYLELPENRRVVDVTRHIINGALYLYRLQTLKCQGLQVPVHFAKYRPVQS